MVMRGDEATAVKMHTQVLGTEVTAINVTQDNLGANGGMRAFGKSSAAFKNSKGYEKRTRIIQSL